MLGTILLVIGVLLLIYSLWLLHKWDIRRKKFDSCLLLETERDQVQCMHNAVKSWGDDAYAEFTKCLAKKGACCNK